MKLRTIDEDRDKCERQVNLGDIEQGMIGSLSSGLFNSGCSRIKKEASN